MDHHTQHAPTLPTTKRCTACVQTKSLAEFPRNCGRPDGYDSRCKSCRDHAKRTFAAANLDRERERKKQYAAATKARMLRRYHEDATYRAELGAKARARRLAHLDTYRAERRAYQRLWRQANPAKNLDFSGQYRARKMAAARVDKVDRAAVIARDRAICHICGKRVLDPKAIHLDHLVPVSKGGDHTANNLAVAHASCNLSRGAGRIPAQLRLLLTPTPEPCEPHSDAEPSRLNSTRTGMRWTC